jgi:hypothetical protein
MYIIRLDMGDTSYDGHNQTQEFWFHSNLSPDELKSAYSKGSGIIGFRLDRQCAEYQDDKIAPEVKIGLIQHLGWLASECEEFDTDSFVEANLGITRLGNPAFEYEPLTPHKVIDIGGYGLFCKYD